jgi:hypothetical protein
MNDNYGHTIMILETNLELAFLSLPIVGEVWRGLNNKL